MLTRDDLLQALSAIRVMAPVRAEEVTASTNATAAQLAEEGTPGRVVEFGSTEDVFNRPKDSRTNDYVNGHFG